MCMFIYKPSILFSISGLDAACTLTPSIYFYHHYQTFFILFIATCIRINNIIEPTESNRPNCLSTIVHRYAVHLLIINTCTHDNWIESKELIEMNRRLKVEMRYIRPQSPDTSKRSLYRHTYQSVCENSIARISQVSCCHPLSTPVPHHMVSVSIYNRNWLQHYKCLQWSAAAGGPHSNTCKCDLSRVSYPVSINSTASNMIRWCLHQFHISSALVSTTTMSATIVSSNNTNALHRIILNNWEQRCQQMSASTI